LGFHTGYLFSSFSFISFTELGEWFLSLFHFPIVLLAAISNAVLCVIWYWLTDNIKTTKIKKGREKRKRMREEKGKEKVNQQGKMMD
jgi:hypothetical protein